MDTNPVAAKINSAWRSGRAAASCGEYGTENQADGPGGYLQSVTNIITARTMRLTTAISPAGMNFRFRIA